MAKKIKVFVDSNIWFSAFYKSGNASKLLQKLNSKLFEVIISELVLEEIIINIKIKIPNALALVYDFFQQYPVIVLKSPSLENIKPYLGLADKKDVPILTNALNYHCQYFITGNLKDFNIKNIKQDFGLEVISLIQGLKL